VLPTGTLVARSTLLGLLASAVIVVGCDRMRDVKRCRTLARQVNASLDVIEKEWDRGPQDASYASIAKEYTALAQGLDGFDGGTPELGRAVVDLGSLARNASRQATGLDEARKADNKLTASVYSRELERLSRQEKGIAARIDDECRPR
jgi:hypothetical protein